MYLWDDIMTTNISEYAQFIMEYDIFLSFVILVWFCLINVVSAYCFSLVQKYKTLQHTSSWQYENKRTLYSKYKAFFY